MEYQGLRFRARRHRARRVLLVHCGVHRAGTHVTSALRQPHRRLGHPLCRPRHHAARHHHHVHHRAALESPV